MYSTEYLEDIPATSLSLLPREGQAFRPYRSDYQDLWPEFLECFQSHVAMKLSQLPGQIPRVSLYLWLNHLPRVVVFIPPWTPLSQASFLAHVQCAL